MGLEGRAAMKGIVYNREMKDLQLLNQQNIETLQEEIIRMKLKTFTKLA